MKFNHPSAGESASAETQGRGDSHRADLGRQIYYQRDDWAASLSGLDPDWQIMPLAESCPAEDCGLAVVFVDQLERLGESWSGAIRDHRARLLYVVEPGGGVVPDASGLPIFAFVELAAPAPVLSSQIRTAFDNLLLSRRQSEIEKQVQRTQSEIDRLNEIGIALSSQHDRESLLNLILQKSREISQSDAGSLYLVEDDGAGGRRLRFTQTQNDSIQEPMAETHLPIDHASIAGYVALTGTELVLDNVYQIPRDLPFTFNASYDEEYGYRCKSMLAVPMKNPQGEIIGVVQLINCKRDAALRVDQRSVDAAVVPFPEQCRPMLRSLASQAAVAVENIRLYESIETLFEGFVRASVTAIESRDPTTSGHSFRVADLTLGLAQAVDRADTAPFRDVRFSRDEMKELRYASLLHDFGKVGVREQVLVKAKKLYPGQLELIQQRFAYARKALEHAQSERQLAYLLDKGRDEFLRQQAGFQGELAAELLELDELLGFIVRCNEPTLLHEGNFARLALGAARQVADADGRPLALLLPQEARLLAIPQGSLDEAERLQIQSHVDHTQNFLRQIPWTKEIKNVAEIAAAHHEKLDGTGYPHSLAAQDIPMQSKMMTIADIFDALSAGDRPYKPAVPWERALDILRDEAKRGLVDDALLGIFRSAEIFRLARNWKTN
jgi:HD-GYP domain-containing protein (c-di-GMP phosphodiesterase class II)